MTIPHTRRAAVGALARLALLGLAAPAMLPRALRAQAWGEVKHPDPRPGVTAEHVLADADVPAKYRDAYQAAREIPEVLDGLFCHCNCAEVRGKRSLLSCFESAMPQSCGICLGEARMAKRMTTRGQSLDEIRKAVDRTYGDRHEERAHHDR